MRKADKKLDNQLRVSLTDVCEVCLKEIPGFSWLTHQVNFQNVSQSLLVICVFEDELSQRCFQESTGVNQLNEQINQALLSVGVKLKMPTKHILFDNEQACATSHNGNWAKRLAAH